MRVEEDGKAKRNVGDSSMGASTEPWPRWAVALASIAIVFHLTAVLSAEFAHPPSSKLQRDVNGYFLGYLNFTNNNCAHRFYARLERTTEPNKQKRWGTPVITAELEGPSSRVVSFRVPDGAPLLPLRRQRQLALAHHLAVEPRWGASYARHLCEKMKCDIVRLHVREHSIPDPAVIRRAIADGKPLDLKRASTYSDGVLIGEFRWGEF